MTAPAVYDAITIADEILKIAKKRGLTLSPMKLMKLTYIAHGWALAILDRDLFRNRIEAWQYGPVIPDLYHATKQFGRNEIPLTMVGEPQDTSVDPETHTFLESVVDKYQNFSAIALSNMTHQTGTPWDNVYVPNMRGVEIPDHLIKQHYEEMLRASQTA